MHQSTKQNIVVGACWEKSEDRSWAGQATGYFFRENAGGRTDVLGSVGIGVLELVGADCGSRPAMKRDSANLQEQSGSRRGGSCIGFARASTLEIALEHFRVIPKS